MTCANGVEAILVHQSGAALVFLNQSLKLRLKVFEKRPETTILR